MRTYVLSPRRSAYFFKVLLTLSLVILTSNTILAQTTTVQLELNQNGFSTLDLTQFDNCLGLSEGVTVTADKQLFSCDDLGENTITLTSKDGSENICTQQITVSVVDKLAPVVVTRNVTKYITNGSITITPQEVLRMNCSGGGISMILDGNNSQFIEAAPNGDEAPLFESASCTYDNCGIATYKLDKSTFTCNDAGQNLVTVTVTDHSGNKTSATAIVTIKDNQAPQVYANNLTIELGADGNAIITPEMVDDNSIDPCGNLTLELSKSVFSCEDLGDNQISLIGTDDSGNTSTAQATITIVDNLGPEVVTQNITITLDDNNQATLDPMDILVVCNDAVIDLESDDDDDGGDFDFGGFDFGGFEFGGFDFGGFDFGGFSPSNQDFDIVPATGIYRAPSPFIVNSYSGEGCTADNCKITGIEANITEFDCNNIGENVVTVTVTDGEGNSTEATAIVTIVDEIAPVVTAQDYTLNLDENGTATLTVQNVETSSSDNCSIVSKELSKTVFTCDDLGTNTVTLTVKDGSGNEASETVTITVQDNIAPTVIAQDIEVYLDENGNASITVEDINNGSSDNCSLSLALDNLAFDCADLGTNTVTLTGTDGSGNTASASATVTVKDNINPIVTAKDFLGYLDANGELTISQNDVVDALSDNCSIANVAISKTEFGCAELGENKVTITVTDAAGNTATATSTVTVEDKTAPVVTVQNVSLNLDASGNATLEVSDVETSSTDNCSIASKVLSQTTFDCDDLGTNTVSLTVTDASGNEVIEEFTVTVVDNIAPNVVAQDITVYLNSNGEALISVQDVNNGSTDNCSLTLELNKTSFNCNDIGANTVTLTGTDAAGNTASATATVTVIDNIAPVIQTVQSLNVELGEDGTVTITQQQVVTSVGNDNCGSVNITISQTDFDCDDLGENTITVTATDSNGNTTTTQVDVFIIDPSTPVWTNPTSGGSTSVTNANPLSPALNFNVFIKEDVTFKSNETEGAVALGGDLTINGNYQVSTNSIGSFQVQNVPVTLVVGGKVNYTSGNSLQVNQNGYAKIGEQNGSKVWYQDMNGAYTTMRVTKNNNYNSNPRLHLQAHANQLGVSEQNNHIFEANVIDFDAAFTQFEASSEAMSQLANNANLTNPNGQPISNTNLPNQVKINLQDGLNVLNVTGSDLNNVSVFTFNNQPSANRILLINVDQPGSFYWNAYNTGGIGEHVAPYIIYNFHNTTYLQVQGNGSLIGSLFAPFAHINKTSHNNISGQIVGKSMMQASGENHMFAFNAEIAGETSGGETTEITQGSTVTKNVDEANCSYTVQGTEFTPGASDTFCSEVSLSYTLSGATTGTGTDLAGVAFNVGTTTITWTATDGQNTTTFSFSVQVEDTTIPTAVGQDIIVSLDANGNASITAAQVNNGSSDNCGTPSLAIDKTNFTCTDLGENTVTLTATDASGNEASTTVTVTIVDDIKPTVIAQDIEVYLDENGNASITVEDINNGSSDNCSLSLALDNLAFDCADLGTNTITLTGTDGSGNTASASATVTVKDNISPIVTAKDFLGYLDANSELTISQNDVVEALSDNCSVVNVTISKTEFGCAELGENTVTITVTDAAGNTTTATSTVTIEDKTAPVVIVQNVSLNLDASGNATLEVSDVETSSTDNCSIASKVLSQTAFDCDDLGSNTVSLTVTDASGNEVIEEFTVTVVDNIAPNVVAQDVTVYLNSNGEALISVQDVNNGSTDNCSLTLELNKTSFDCSDLGTNTVLLTGTDASGNSATASAVVTVVDAINPVVTAKDFLGYLDANGELTISQNDVVDALSDNCSVVNVTISKTEFGCAELGENTVTITVTDAAGNTAIATSTVTIKDKTAPVVTVQNVSLNLDASGNATLEVSDVETSSTDNCGIASKVLSQTTFDCDDLGTNTVSLTVTDASGNEVIEEFTVTIVDNIAPNVVAQDITVYLNSNGEALISVQDVNNGSTDNCSLTLELNKTSFDCNDLGTNTVLLTGTDASGNSAAASAIITVVDAINPVVTAKDFLGHLDANGELTISQNDVVETLSDNCSVANVSISKTQFGCAELGENTVTITVTDAAGNTATATSTVTIADNIAPSLSSMPTNITVQATNGCSAIANWTTPQVSDNCSATITSDYTSGQSFNVGTTTVTYTATDVAGNTSTASFNVTVLASPITVTLSPNEQSNGYNVSCYGASDGSITATVTGGCGTYSYVWSNGTTGSSVSNLSAGTYSLTVTDGQGNTKSATVNVTQPDVLAVNTSMTPVAPGGNGAEDHVIYLGYGQQSVTLSANATGGSGNYNYTWSPNQAMGCVDGNTVEVAPLVTTTYSVLVTDAMGCTATKDITVTVIDVRCTDNDNGDDDDDDHGDDDDDDSHDSDDDDDDHYDDDDDDDDGGYPGGGSGSDQDCQCEGKMKNFTVVYNGYSGATVKAYNKKKNTVIKTFYNVQNGQSLKVEGFDHKGRLDSKTYLKVGNSYTEIHTSCSIDILGETYGPFKVMEYTDGEGVTCQDPGLSDFNDSDNGSHNDDDDDDRGNHDSDDDDDDRGDDDDDDKGKDKSKKDSGNSYDFDHSNGYKNISTSSSNSSYGMSAVSNSQSTSSDCQCEGKMKNFTVVYRGTSGVTVKVFNKKKDTIIKTFYNVQNGQELKVEGFDHKGRLDSKTYLKVGNDYTEIHTSCSINILGATYGDFKVIEYTDGEGYTCSLSTSEPNECGLTLTQWSGNITICYNGQAMCIEQTQVDLYLSQGATLGSCGDGNSAKNTGKLVSNIGGEVTSPLPTIEIDIDAYPNPTKDYANITFSTNTTANASVAVYDTRGMIVGKLFEGTAEKGETYKVEFNGSNVINGVYLIRVNLGNHVETKKLLIKH
ncbi:collagen-binding domain-containing protein [Roseivirga pacifica]|uniref:collagen-binding domain-containing protein n=1 Tax=Roseivirga pacifica TaxID=1267423 RepID=UPI002095CF20|nr:collagen-binding domain-containing protein [Roseivirga pacifica]MCO6359949.1 choice-of-anchor A family protein [Roseivirga pacifica]MCO6367319.1 choice-of-anchor A family protein [Roseivirga pacifica]MCO6370149.1 choice-of-anchor A family protein [Roseivirga pacifica]MCO6374976.1 choice-of-anchor A family protein [Roseivirga pacifica]MCO6380234.1 choice-of-anchor A family protein [Roseivirga pacifica]